MNLAFAPWIPCTRADGTAWRASLLQCLADDGIADMAVRPHERVALMRLLLCVAHAALGIPEDRASWQSCRERLADASARYLEQWRDSFELFHPQKPFLQVTDLRSAARGSLEKAAERAEDGLTSTAKLDFALSSGNNSTLFDHEALKPFRAAEPEKLALDLLTFQMFSTGGTIGKVFWNGEPMFKPEEQKNPSASSCDAPCVCGSMTHTFVKGSSLPESVWLNLLSADCLRDYADLGGDWRGRPLWEAFPQGPHDEAAVRNATRTFLGRMVPLSRAILLKKDGALMLLGNGLSYPSFSLANQDFPPEPSAAVIALKKRKGVTPLTVLGVLPSKALWRDLPALTEQRRCKGPGGCLALAHADGKDGKGVDLMVGGLARDKAAIEDEVEYFFHVPPSLFRKRERAFYANEVRIAEKMERKALSFAMVCWRTALDGGWNARLKLALAAATRREKCAKLRAQASRDYWSAVERNLPFLTAMIEALDSDYADVMLHAWRRMVRESALDAYATACRGDSVRQLRAFATGKRILLAMADKILELHKEK